MASAHAPPTPLATPPLRVSGNRILDANGAQVLLRGASLPVVAATAPPALVFRVIQQRWNMNAVRIPASVNTWQSSGQSYLDGIAALVAAASREGLVVILSAHEDGGPMPGALALAFWRAAATQFRGSSGLIFSLADEPRSIPGDRAAAWRAWDAAMQPLVDAIRATGATQVIAAPAMADGLDFQAFGRDFFLRDPNVIYEVHPTALGDDARDRNFGFLVNDVVVFAGAWGGIGGGCTAAPDDLLTTLAYFDRRNVGWTVAYFAPGSLLANYEDFTASDCSAAQAVLLWMTGDPGGFGSIDPTQLANAAGGFPGPVAPGEILSIYGQNIGPQQSLGPNLTDGRVDSTLGEVQVLFDGVPAPILMAGYFQVNVQAPYEIADRKTITLQLFNRGVPSNKVELAVTASAPQIFTSFTGGSDALALNPDGTLNGAASPAPRGGVVAFFATGAGQTTPSGATGVPAKSPLAVPAVPIHVTIGGLPAEILYAGPAPTLVGVTQINVRVPDGAAAGRAAVVMTAGTAASRSGVVLWVQ